MNTIPTYDTKEDNSKQKLRYYFESLGEKTIIKVIEYSVINIIGGRYVYNLGFGDYNEDTGEISDDISSNNGDVYIVFNTVLNTVPLFFTRFPDAVIMVGGSDSHSDYAMICQKNCKKNCIDDCKNAKRRIRTYRNYVNKNFKDLSFDYIFFGRKKNEENTFVQYIPGNEYDEILVYKKK